MSRVTIAACLFLLFIPGILKAQYTSEIDGLYAVLKKTPSYKEQMKGEKKVAYEDLYRKLRNDSAGASTVYARFLKLSQLLLPLKDNHLGFWQSSSAFFEYADFSDSLSVKKFGQSKIFADYPHCRIDLDSLEGILVNKPKDSVEGIYYYDRYLKAGVFRTEKKDSLIGVVLQAGIPNWEKGQIAFFLKEHKPNRFRAIYGHPFRKFLILYKNERFERAALVQSHFYGSLTESVWKKFPNEPDFVNPAHDVPAFQLKQLTPAIQYLRLGHFSTKSDALAESMNFYTAIKDSLTADYLIVDLRNNTGGGFKVSKRFLNLLKRYARRGKIFALINAGTYSHGEQFTIALKKSKNVMSLGETTNGTMTYGNNYEATKSLPGGDFTVYITDMKDDGHFLPYEDVGVSPDIFLDPSSDWIEQTKQIVYKEQNTAQ